MTIFLVALQPSVAGPGEALRDLARPIEGTGDLDELIDRAAQARLVLLGESSHGTQEYYTWRAEITRRLVAEHGFRVIAVEGDWPSFRFINRYVKHHPDAPATAREALEQFERWPQWMWANEPVLELVEWLREHNSRLPAERRAGFYGLDVYGVADSIAQVIAYLEGIDPEAADQARQLYHCLARFDDPQAYPRFLNLGGNSCAPAVDAVVNLLRDRGEELRQRDPKTYFHAKQNALTIQSVERHLRAALQAGPGSWNLRVEHMKQTLLRLIEQYDPEARTIVWAHNTHIGDASATAMADAGMRNIGELLRQRFGDNAVFAVGFATHRGTVIAGRRWGGEGLITRVPPAQEGSLEAMLHEIGQPMLLIPLDRNDHPPALAERLPHRAKGVVYDPEQEAGNYVPTILPLRYDALLYFDRTRALSPLGED